MGIDIIVCGCCKSIHIDDNDCDEVINDINIDELQEDFKKEFGTRYRLSRRVLDDWGGFWDSIDYWIANRNNKSDLQELEKNILVIKNNLY